MPNRPRIKFKVFGSEVGALNKFVIFKNYGLRVCININCRITRKSWDSRKNGKEFSFIRWRPVCNLGRKVVSYGIVINLSPANTHSALISTKIFNRAICIKSEVLVGVVSCSNLSKVIGSTVIIEECRYKGVGNIYRRWGWDIGWVFEGSRQNKINIVGIEFKLVVGFSSQKLGWKDGGDL